MKHSESWYRPGRTVHVHDKMQQDYSYVLTAPYGHVHSDLFQPELTPAQMLSCGIFEGKYMNDGCHEFPKEWYEKAKLSSTPNPEINFFQLKSRLPLQTWQDKGWIIGPDVRGWFQWYCRYFIGRRIPDIDQKQIARWRSFARHKGQVSKHCKRQDMSCRPRQRQALLQWSYNPFF